MFCLLKKITELFAIFMYFWIMWILRDYRKSADVPMFMSDSLLK